MPYLHEELLISRALAEAEVSEACESSLSSGRRFTVHFVRASYLQCAAAARRCVATTPSASSPALLLGCAGGVLVAAAHVPPHMVTDTFTAERWLECVLPIFKARILQPPPSERDSLRTRAEMCDTKVKCSVFSNICQIYRVIFN